MVDTEDSDSSSAVSSDSDSEDDTATHLVALFSAIQGNDYDKAKDIINQNISVINLSLNGTTALHETIKQRTKCDVNTKNANKCLIEELLKRGADVNAKNQKGESALTIVKKQLKKNPDNSDWQSLKYVLQPQKTSDSSKGKSKKKSGKDPEEGTSSSSTTKDEIASSGSKQTNKRKTDDDSDNYTKRTKPVTESYAVSGLKTSLHGTVYQLQLLMLLMHRGLDKYPYFDLATEMNQAEKFDDAVVRYKENRTDKWLWRFLQAKHKEDVLRDRITVKDLLTESEGPFSFQKYFLSFCKIKNNAIFVASDLIEFDLCTNTDLDFSEKTKRDQDRNLSASAQHHNDLVKLWKSLLVEEKLNGDVLLFFRGINAKKFKLKSEAIVEFEKLMRRLFFSSEFQSKTLPDWIYITDKINSVKLIEQCSIVDELNVLCEKLDIVAKSTKTEKGKFTDLAKQILKLKGYFLDDSQYDNVAKMSSVFQETKAKDQCYFTKRNDFFTVCKNILQDINDSLTEAKNKVDSLKNIHTPEFKLLNDEIQKVHEKMRHFIDARNEICNCTDMTSLNNKLASFPDLQKKLETLTKDNSSLDHIREKLSNVFEKNISECVLLELAVDEDKFTSYLKEFLEKFRLLTCYPDVDKLNVLIKREMGQRFSFLNSDLITDSFQKQMLDWFKEYNKGKSEFLSSDKGDRFFKSINREITSIITSGLNEAYPARLKRYNVNFKSDDFNGFLKSDRNFLHITSKSTRLSAIKFLQAVIDSKLYLARDSFIFVSLDSLARQETQDLVIRSFRAHQSHDLFVIDCQQQTTIPYIEQFIEAVAEILENQEKKFVLITSKDNNLAEEFQTFESIKLQNKSDTNTFKNLDKTSQNDLLKKMIVFQNNSIELGRLIGLKSARDIIDETILENIIRNELQVGDDKIFSSFGYVSEYYQSRRLGFQTVRETIFSIPQSIFFLTNDDDDEDTKKQHTEIWEARTKYADVIVIPEQNDNYERVFQGICEQYQDRSIYWIHQNSGKLFWKRSKSDCKHIQSHIVDNLVPLGFYCEENIDFLEKIVIVANNPGVGKSTFLTSLSRGIKKKHEDCWVCRINLNDYAFEKEFLPSSDNRIYTRSLREVKNNISEDDAIDFISEMIIPQDPCIPNHNFQRILFKKGLQHADDVNPKVVILFDGFDEISPLFKENTIKLLSKFRNSAVLQIWITTRVHEKQSLENTFLCPAYILNPFTDDQQIAFLTNFWNYNLTKKLKHSDTSDEQMGNYLEIIAKNLNLDEPHNISFRNFDQLSSLLSLREFAERLVYEWKSTASDERKTFTNNPLQLKMLADIIFWENFELIHQIGLIDLFEKFMNMKFNIYYHDKHILGHGVGSLEVRKDHSEPLRQKHRLLAILEIYPDINEDVENPVGQTDTSNLIRVGLLIKSGTRLVFVHRSFAEYLLNEYLTMFLYQNISQKILFTRLFSEGRHSLIASFFDEFVKNKSPQMTLNDQTVISIEYMLSLEYNDIFMHQLALNGFHNTLKFVLTTLKQYPVIQEKVLLKPGIYGKFAIFDVAYNIVRGLSRLEKIAVIKIFLEHLIDQDELLVKIFTARYKDLGIVLGNKQPFVTCFQLSLFTLTDTEEIFKLFMNSIRNKPALFEEIMFRNGLDAGETLLHFCCMFVHKKLGFLFNLLDPFDHPQIDIYINVLERLILSKDTSGRTALHWLAFRRYHQGIDTFLTWVKTVSERLVFTLLNITDNMKINPLDMAIYRNDRETTTAFLNSMRTNLSSVQFNAIVGQNDSQNSVLYKATSQGKTASMMALLDLFKEYFGSDPQGQSNYIALLMEKHHICGRTAITLAAARDFDSTLEKLLYWLKDFSDNSNSSTLFLLLSMQDYSGKTIIHETALFGTKSLRVLMKFLIQHLDCQQLIELLLLTDRFNDTALYFARKQESKQLLNQGYDIIYATVVSLSEIPDILQHTVIFSHEQLTILEDVVQKFNEHNSETILTAITKLKCLMNYDMTVVPTSSAKTSTLFLPSDIQQ